MTGTRCLAAAALLGATAACASDETARTTSLPFHAALVPVEVFVDAPRAPQEASAETDAEDRLALALDGSAASRALADTLRGSGFTSVTLLPPPPEGVDADEHWLQAAKAAGADVLLTSGELRYAPSFDSRRNEKFWLNLPLFLLGGPFCYWVDDRTFVATASLEIDVYDVSALRRPADLDVLRNKLVSSKVRFDEVALDFVDRGGLSAGTVAASLVVPAGFLATENEDVREELEGAVLHQLAGKLRDDLVDKRGSIEWPEQLVSFRFVDAPVVERAPDGSVTIRAEVGLRDDGLAERMREWRVFGVESRPDAEPRVTPIGTYRFGEHTVDEAGRFPTLVYALDERIDRVDPAFDRLRIELVDDSPNANRRTYTLVLAPAADA